MHLNKFNLAFRSVEDNYIRKTSGIALCTILRTWLKLHCLYVRSMRNGFPWAFDAKLARYVKQQNARTVVFMITKDNGSFSQGGMNASRKVRLKESASLLNTSTRVWQWRNVQSISAPCNGTTNIASRMHFSRFSFPFIASTDWVCILYFNTHNMHIIEEINCSIMYPASYLMIDEFATYHDRTWWKHATIS